jgi:hypothetical protein
MTIAELFTKDERNVVEELEEDAQKDIKLLKQILDLHAEKLAKVKELIDVWETGRNTEIIDSFMAEIKNTNKKLLRLIEKILKLETREESIIKLLLARNAEVTGLEAQQHIERLIEKMDEHLRYFKDILINLKFLIEKQNDYIKRHWSGAIVKDIKEHLAFYIMLVDETTIEERLKKFVVMVEHETRYLLNLVEKKSEGIVSFEEVFSPYSPDFIKLYNEIYIKAFPDSGELLSLKDFKDSIRNRYKRKSKDVYHILILKIGPTPVGAAMFSTYPINNLVCAGAIYYFFLEKDLSEDDLKRKGLLSKQLFTSMLQLLKRDLQKLGYKELSIIVAEFDNPERKTEFKFKRRKDKTGIKRYKYVLERNIRLMRFVGFRKADFMYIVSDLEDPSKDVTYFDFYVFPLREKWKTSKRMHSSEFLPILKLFVEEGYELLEERPELYDIMEKEIVAKKWVQLI